ncbi:MAG TPA: universal stress protein [Methanotrichaceae archaeon]|nr:universal stress protein [Methanotrichaceae archaeon]
MYKTIAVAVDNSACSKYAESIALQIALTGKIPVTGIHAYTGKFHQARFNALERLLPEKYLTEEVLSHQRDIHSVLIGRGLELISLEYMKRLGDACRTVKIPFTEKIVDGKNADVVISESEDGGLSVVGAEGLGRVEGISGLGSTTRRTLRHGTSDLLIAKKEGQIESILAGVDGSAEAFMMVGTASDLARSLGATLTLAACFDPGLHRTVFGSLSATLSKETENVFKFSEQEQLHNEIIDRSLADLYSRHLEHATDIAREHGVEAKTRLMQGKPFHILCTLAEELESDLIVVGHSGMHRSRYSDIGSNTERAVELAKTNVLIVRNRKANTLATDKGQNASSPVLANSTSITDQPALLWSDDAKKRLDNIPGFARKMTIMAIERHAKEHKISTITPEVMNATRKKLDI